MALVISLIVTFLGVSNLQTLQTACSLVIGGFALMYIAVLMG